MRKIRAEFDAWTARVLAPLSREALEEGIDTDKLDPEAVEGYGLLGLQLMVASMVLKALGIVCSFH